MSRPAITAACEAIVEAAPGLLPIWREHLSDHNDEALPHVFFGDVARYFEGWADTASDDELSGFLAAIERLAGAKGYEENLINVSFIEHFAWGNERQNGLLDRLWSRFGSATQRAVVGMRNYPDSLTWDDKELERRAAAQRSARDSSR